MKGLKRQDTNFNKSIGPNMLTDDPIMKNYIALAKCIGGVVIDGEIKYPSISQACSAYKLYDSSQQITESGEVKETTTTKAIFKIENVTTGEVVEVKGGKAVCDLIGIKRGSISYYTNKGFKYKGTYLISRIDKYKNLRASRMRRIKITNIENGDIKEFKTIKDAAEYLERAEATLHYHISRKSVTNNHRIEYAD
ncbi:hypothetical protein [Romboutsia lituseburensis]|uniref:NUMOD1 domain-containing protein n=1 Tax=Romboutsia lituseburensis DSM 797 TaxID=1121325 RepID=A0A1G9U1U2_9FIRM|nr:hypothetical protein [Romboutsia lituseburensis]CEH34748.1 Intron encoded nuclease repeat motif [Romboutsia lituseburensis]SDM53957.1 hypothetical protein SAMN04515677_11457 [Romboutsia lituseburensis DSM 797]